MTLCDGKRYLLPTAASIICVGESHSRPISALARRRHCHHVTSRAALFQKKSTVLLLLDLGQECNRQETWVEEYYVLYKECIEKGVTYSNGARDRSGVTADTET